MFITSLFIHTTTTPFSTVFAFTSAGASVSGERALELGIGYVMVRVGVREVASAASC